MIRRPHSGTRSFTVTWRSVLSVSAIVIGLAVLPAPAFAAGCPNEALRVGPSAGLPDCRAYEQVTPVEKNGGIFEPGLTGVGADGTPDLVMTSFATIAGLQDNFGTAGGVYSTVRTGSGWATSALPPPASEYQTGGNPLMDMSLDARSALWFERSVLWPENRVDLLITRPGGAIEDAGILTPPNTPPGGVFQIVNSISGGLGIGILGWTNDLSHVLYSQNKLFWPFDTTREEASGDITHSLYEIVGTGNTQPMLVGLGNDGKLISDCGTDLGGGVLQREEHINNAVSADGVTVFFTALACKGSPPANELFARIDNGQPDAHTVAISEPTEADCSKCETNAPREATFEGASADGSKVFFETEQPLLGHDGTLNVYEYDFSAPVGTRLVRVSGGDATVSDPSAEVQGHIVAMSEDGSHAYFVAHGVLTMNPNAEGQTAQAGANNLYVFERDARYPDGHTTFIAGLSGSDKGLWQGTSAVDVTQDGRFLVFASVTEHLTPDDTSTASQVFEYDAQMHSLTRVSIGQNGYNQNGNSDIAGASIPPRHDTYSDPTNYWSGLTVSADGSYVFFQSTDGLTPQALNYKRIGERVELGVTSPVYANNVYEYHDGNVYLISDGRDVSQAASFGELSDVELIGTNASGADVLFTTVDRLTRWDGDSNLDIYDARIGGGFPAPLAPAKCASDGCQGPLSSAPVLLLPGSEFQAGGGNLPTSKPLVLTLAQKLANALKACAKKPKKRRAACRSQAKRRYKAKKAARATKGGGQS